MQPSKHYVFVYGTLKRGEPNEHWLTDESNGFSKFICRATTMEKYPLIIASKYNIPFLLDSPGTGKFVNGEIYEVDSQMLSNLDILEDYPQFYAREIRKFCTHEGTNIDAWVYLLQKYRHDLLKSSEYLSEYQSRGSHGKIYCEKSSRDDSPSDAMNEVQGV